MGNKGLVVLVAVLWLWGCARPGPGRLYANVVRPYSTDFNHTSVGSKQCIIKDYRLKEPVSGYGVTVEWSSSQIQAAARSAGIERISYIDVQTISLLMGLYSRRKLIIYGD